MDTSSKGKKPKPLPILPKPNGDIISRGLNTKITDLTVDEFKKIIKESLIEIQKKKK